MRNGSARFIPVTSVHCLPIIVSTAGLVRWHNCHYASKVRVSLLRLSVAFILLSCPSDSTFELDLLRVLSAIPSFSPFFPSLFCFVQSVSKIAANTFDICMSLSLFLFSFIIFYFPNIQIFIVVRVGVATRKCTVQHLFVLEKFRVSLAVNIEKDSYRSLF